ncbi:Rhodanese-like domain-containing protein 11, chloroplastic, partial [Tetrabaena socialis]
VPVFLEDEEVSLSSLIKRASAFGMGGWWLGGSHMVPNDKFLSLVQAQVPTSARLVVGCQKGLRSLAACEQLSLAGYETLAWVNGGFDSCKSGEVRTEGDVDIRYAGIGGLSEAIGWTVVQQEQNKALGSADGVLKVVGLILVADLMLFAGEYVQAFLEGKM